MATIALILRVLLASILARSALHKWRSRSAFVAELRAYRLLPDPLASPAATSLAFVETLAALGLLMPSWSTPAAIAASLFGTYAVAMAINLLRGRTEIGCGCGGPLAARTTIDWTLVARNALLVGLALVILATPILPLSVAHWAVVAAASAAAVLLYESMEQAIANRQRVSKWKASWTH